MMKWQTVERHWTATLSKDDDALWETQAREKPANAASLFDIDVLIHNVTITFDSQDRMRNDYVEYGGGLWNSL